MIFQDARSKYRLQFAEGRKEPNPYYQEYLNAKDREFLDGYDWTKEQEMESFFNNLDTYGDEIEKEDFDIDKIDYELLNKDEITEEEKEKASVETRIMIWLKTSIYDHIEMARDELVTSMIDSMDEKEYEANYKRFWRNEKIRKAREKG